MGTAGRLEWIGMTGSNPSVPVVDLSGDDWPLQLEALLATDPALREAFNRRHSVGCFLSGLHGVVNQLPTMDGAAHSQPADTRHERVDIGVALARADELPGEMRAVIRAQLAEIRAMAVTHNLAVNRWREAIRGCYYQLERLCAGPYRAMARALSMQVMDRMAQADDLATMAQAYRLVAEYAAQLPDDPGTDEGAVPVPVDDHAVDDHAVDDHAMARAAARSRPARCAGDRPGHRRHGRHTGKAH